MKRLITRSAHLAVCAACLAVTVGFLPSADAQETTWVDFGADFDYLFTLQDLGQGWQAFDPTYDELFYSEPGTGLNGDALWAIPGYDISVPVNAVRPDFTNATTLAWDTGASPFEYGTINYFNNNGIVIGTDFEASVDNGGLGFVEADGDGEKWTHYFRTEFSVDSPASQLFAEVVIDDGAIFYIDGKEVGVWNCCDADPRRPEVVDPALLRQYELNGINTGGAQTEDQINTPSLNLGNLGGVLAAGTHVLGVEVHQGNRTSSDMAMYVRLFTTDEDNQWGLAAGGSWQNAANWTLGLPNSVGAEANLWGSATGPATIYNNGALSLGTISFDNEKYAVAGLGTLTFETTDANSSVSVLQGDHEFQIAVALNNDTDVNVAAGASLEFNNDVNGNGNSLNISGGGTVALNNATSDLTVSMAAGAMTGGGSVGGDLINSGAVLSPGDGVGVMSVIGNFSQGEDGILAIDLAGRDNYDLLDIQGSADLGGALNVSLLGGFEPSLGDEFDILNFSSASGSFDTMSLPALGEGLQWDMSNLYAAGNLAVVPEPTGILLLVCGGFAFGFIRPRRSS